MSCLSVMVPLLLLSGCNPGYPLTRPDPSTDGGGSAGQALCREVETAYDAATAPRQVDELADFMDMVQDLQEVNWEFELGALGYSYVSMRDFEPSGDAVVVDWVADGSADAVHPCLDGPATRVYVETPLTLDWSSFLGDLAVGEAAGGVGGAAGRGRAS